MESWIEVIDGYKVSNLGEVYSTRTNKILKKHTDRYGYLYVEVYIDGRLKFKAERMFCPKQLYKKP